MISNKIYIPDIIFSMVALLLVIPVFEWCFLWKAGNVCIQIMKCIRFPPFSYQVIRTFSVWLRQFPLPCFSCSMTTRVLIHGRFISVKSNNLFNIVVLTTSVHSSVKSAFNIRYIFKSKITANRKFPLVVLSALRKMALFHFSLCHCHSTCYQWGSWCHGNASVFIPEYTAIVCARYLGKPPWFMPF